MATTPSQAAINYSGHKGFTVHLPATEIPDENGADSFFVLEEPLSGGAFGFGWLGYADSTNIPIVLASQPLSVAVGDAFFTDVDVSKSQLASYSSGDAIGSTGSYKTEGLEDGITGSSFFMHFSDSSSTDAMAAEPAADDLFTDWQLDSTAFVGVRADAGAGAGYRYGWMRFTTPPNFDAGAALTLVDWAFETDLNTPIMAGDGVIPAPAPLPALGAAAALAASRLLRRRVKQAQADGSAVTTV
jgi:hypothetical protein